MKKLYLDLLKHLTVSWRVECACTEAKTIPGSIADILAITKKGIVELEIKESINDIHNERKKEKHKHYNLWEKYKRSLPQYFAIVIPESMIEDLCRAWPEFPGKYGIITYTFSYNAETLVFKEKVPENAKQYEFKYYLEPKRLNKGAAYYLRKEIPRRLLCDHVELLK